VWEVRGIKHGVEEFEDVWSTWSEAAIGVRKYPRPGSHLCIIKID